ncbi:aldo/keto reductase [Chitinophaga ginsengisoli]|uniref:Aryl-alcohol dehydrogenase-like predicted oxidoreductase n=1 Tax=Chitinophaga ginsengisoli TaxID=363837 RepID=A0A2P8GM54_9BACT|nr:aldo/keto reductase [Chitinophaga ginsengisoli]PSL35040.1 aryl-alcohol dehydrogenase-like predicted oxidoreductase [Chitinophaga ginsengisoli]
MNYRPFKDVQVAEVGLGTWQLGSADWGNIDEEEAIKILKAYTDAGGNFIDTADVYGMGVSETIIGKFLQSADKELFVATKLGRRGDVPNGWPQNFTYDAMKRHAEESLQHLGLSQLFLEQLHCIPTEEMRSGKVFDNLRKLQQEGLIRYFGASVETSEEAMICLEQEGLASLQIIFNLFRQHVADEVFAKAKEKGVALIIRVPLASGLLSGKFKEDTVFEENDHRNYNANGEAFNTGETFSGIEFREGVKLAGSIRALLPDEHMAAWAIRWILDHPEVTTVIPGASKISQVNSNVAASGLQPLSAAAHAQLRKLYDEEIHSRIRGHY